MLIQWMNTTLSCCVLISHAFLFTINRRIKHDFPFINIPKVPREVLKSEGEVQGFQPSRGTLGLLTNDKVMFDAITSSPEPKAHR